MPAHKLEEDIRANLKPNEASLKQIDQAVDTISDLLRSEIPVMKVAKVRLRAGARALDSGRESPLSPQVVVLTIAPHQAQETAL